MILEVGVGVLITVSSLMFAGGRAVGRLTALIASLEKKVDEQSKTNSAHHKQHFEANTSCERERGELGARVAAMHTRVEQLVRSGG